MNPAPGDNQAAHRHDSAGATLHRSSVIDNGLTDSEEEQLQTWILSLDNDHLLPTLPTVRDMANLLLEKRQGSSPQKVNVEWARGYIQRMPLLQSSFASQAKDEGSRSVDGKSFICSSTRSSPEPPTSQGPRVSHYADPNFPTQAANIGLQALKSTLAGRLLKRSKASMDRTVAEYKNIVKQCERAIDDITMRHRDQEYILNEIDELLVIYKEQRIHDKRAKEINSGRYDHLFAVQGNRMCSWCHQLGHTRKNHSQIKAMRAKLLASGKDPKTLSSY